MREVYNRLLSTDRDTGKRIMARVAKKKYNYIGKLGWWVEGARVKALRSTGSKSGVSVVPRTADVGDKPFHIHYQDPPPHPSPTSIPPPPSISTPALHSTKSSNSSLTVFNFSFTLATPSNPTMCLAGGFSCPPTAVTAWIVSAINNLFISAGKDGYTTSTLSAEERECGLARPGDGLPGVKAVGDSVVGREGGWEGERRSKRPPIMERARGAGCAGLM